jgi:hypothetical protein
MDDFDFFMDEQVEEKEEFPNLPKELQGIDLEPDESEKLKNDFPTLKQYITISFTEDQTKELAKILGLPVLDPKRQNTYSFDQIKGAREDGLL